MKKTQNRKDERKMTQEQERIKQALQVLKYSDDSEAQAIFGVLDDLVKGFDSEEVGPGGLIWVCDNFIYWATTTKENLLKG
jgi:hypothetical protein